MSNKLGKYKDDKNYKSNTTTFLGSGAATGSNKNKDFFYNSSTKEVVSVDKNTGDYTTVSKTSGEGEKLIQGLKATDKVSKADSNYSKAITQSESVSGSSVLSSITQNDSKKGRTDYPVSYYPLNLATTKQDRIRFKMKSVGTRTLTSADPFSGTLSGFGPRSGGDDIKGEVYLSIPSQINDQNTADWSSATMNPLQTTMASLAIGAMKGTGKVGIDDFSSAATTLAGNVMNNLKSFAMKEGNRSAMQVLLAQEAVQTQGLLSRLGGVVANPNVELLFNGPSLRPFTFTFRMSPRDSSEAIQVKQIIRFFKEGMSVQTTDQDVFLKSPNVFDIQFQSGSDNNPHKSLPRIKTCALVACDVDYTPDGSYMTFNDPNNGYPMTCYQMTLRFNEIEPVYAEDYKSVPSNDIGY